MTTEDFISSTIAVVNKSDNKDQERAARITAIANDIWQYGLPCIVVPGILGNVLCIIVLKNDVFRKTSTGFLMTCLAIADIVMLMTGPLRQWLIALLQWDIQLLSDFSCKLLSFTWFFSLQTSSWTLVLLTLARLISVWKPLNVATICSKRNMTIAWIAMVFLLAISDCYLLDRLQIINLTTANNTIIINYCAPELNDILEKYHDWINIGLMCFFPAAIIIVSNISIIILLRKGKQRRSNTMGVSTSARDIKAKSEQSVTIMLITVSVWFLVTSLPVNIYYILRTTVHSDYQDNIVTYAQSYMAYVTLNIILDANNAFNFVLYFLSGAKFRKAFLGTFSSFRSMFNRKPTPTTGRGGITATVNDVSLKYQEQDTSNTCISVITDNSEIPKVLEDCTLPQTVQYHSSNTLL